MLLLKGDCLELMKNLPDKSVDLFICDLPYGCLTGGGGKEKARRIAKNTNLSLMRMENGVATGKKAETPNGLLGGCSWDIKLDLNAFWIQVKRLCKNDHTPVLMFCNTKFGYDLIKSNESWFRYDLVWNKMRGVSFLSANKMPMKSHEMVYVFSKKGANYYRKDIEGDFKRVGGGRNTAASFSKQYGGVPLTGVPDNEGKRCALSVINNSTSSTKGGHPTEKPVELYKWLIERYSKEGDMVLDPTFGSGNSGRASAELKRRYTGIEMNEKFYNEYKSSVETNVSATIPTCDKEVEGNVS